MTSEPEREGRRPPTIELKATEIEGAQAPNPSRPSETSPGAETRSAGERVDGASGSRLKAYALGALGGATAITALAGAAWFGGLAPSPPTAAPPASQGAIPPNDEVSARLDKIEAAIKAQQPQAESDRLTAAEAQQKSLGDSLAALTRRIDELAATAQTAQNTTEAAAAAAEAAKNAAQAGVQPSAIDALTSRVAALESTVKSLADQVAQRSASADDRTLRLAIVAEILRAAVESSASYQAELDAAKSLGADPALVTQLEPFAAAGLPSAPALAHKLLALFPALQRASDGAGDDADFLERLKANARNLVRITPVDAPPGTDLSAVLARIDSDAAQANIAGALADIPLLPDTAKSLAADWIKKAQARETALAAGRQLAGQALAALGKTAAQ